MKDHENVILTIASEVLGMSTFLLQLITSISNVALQASKDNYLS